MLRIDPHTIRQFRAWLGRLPGRAAAAVAGNTVRKHLVTLKAMLHWAAPRGPGNEDAVCKRGLFGTDADGDLRYPPAVKLPPQTSKTPDPLSLEHIRFWLEACDAARAPRLPYVAPADWWRALLLFSYNAGTRIETTLRIEWPMVRGDWLVIPAAAVKGRRHELRIWLNAPARAAAESIRRDRLRMFAWPHAMGWLMQTQHRIMAASRIPPEERYGGTHRLRKALATWLTARNPAVARMQLGHSMAGDVLLGHYADPSIVAELMEQVPQPSWKTGQWPVGGDRQLLLF